ncbi:glycosyltransferase family 4 protein [Zunongwangia sp. SCSIO 43204]|uniref:glycosyltransferase family 4 protein n=1 Tax=Zunongwangia sp. SCSIO 43204 TaxID=2779359 RepID=UPI001CA92E73|nr:glycosyltransferase family 4 protein [Zunongwangia sp. SCSIO 43204]UAB86183.1 glycosyltransferase family 4 protein [Zunongwangia sp. SCSIO 43204]
MSAKSILYIGNKLAKLNRTPTSADILPGLLQKEGFEVYSFSSKINKVSRLAEMLLKTLQLGPKVDWVIIDVYSTQNFWYAYLCGKICKLNGILYINILHGGNLEKRLKTKYLPFFRNAEYNIAPSQFLLSKFLTSGLENLKFIPNSIPLEEYKFKSRYELKPKLLWVRAFAEIYNPFLAIQLLEALLQDYKDAELFMVGPKKDESYEQCKKYVEEHNLPVHFTGKLEKQDWHQLSEQCDLFINTARIDNTPVSIVEAMALGLPVLSSNVGGIPYLIIDQEDGVLYNNADLEDLIAKTKDLLENSVKISNISLRARKKIEGFNWEIVKKLWLNILS